MGAREQADLEFHARDYIVYGLAYILQPATVPDYGYSEARKWKRGINLVEFRKHLENGDCPPGLVIQLADKAGRRGRIGVVVGEFDKAQTVKVLS